MLTAIIREATFKTLTNILLVSFFRPFTQTDTTVSTKTIPIFYVEEKNYYWWRLFNFNKPTFTELTSQKMETKTVFIRNVATDEQGFTNKFPFWHQTNSIKAQDKNKTIKGNLTLYSYIRKKNYCNISFRASRGWTCTKYEMAVISQTRTVTIFEIS